ncbi:hypothetical protein B0H16DRAFT_1560558 [Mycena metata]|uniref:Uncharacterized protein n=1 Tax=Mycena metata TaxID=1033252 RepID=A0AAD7N381_9AGAR|nr:hypothetical protein B0H16DRAFT_1560558 [Mycena metata]
MSYHDSQQTPQNLGCFERRLPSPTTTNAFPPNATSHPSTRNSIQPPVPSNGPRPTQTRPFIASPSSLCAVHCASRLKLKTHASTALASRPASARPIPAVFTILPPPPRAQAHRAPNNTSRAHPGTARMYLRALPHAPLAWNGFKSIRVAWRMYQSAVPLNESLPLYLPSARIQSQVESTRTLLVKEHTNSGGQVSTQCECGGNEVRSKRRGPDLSLGSSSTCP